MKKKFKLMDQTLQAVPFNESITTGIITVTFDEQVMLQQLIDDFELPDDLFSWIDRPEIAGRLEYLQHTKLKNAYLLVLTNMKYAENKIAIEKQLESILFIVSDKLLICCSEKNSQLVDQLLNQSHIPFDSLESVVGESILKMYHHFSKGLEAVKKDIDQLDKSSRNTTKNEELFRLADTERKMVYLTHTLELQDEVLNELCHNRLFTEQLNNDQLLYDIQLYNRQVTKMLHIYRDLLETIGGLFSDMMSNNLNHLMKYLDSAALIISIPTLISGLWGMNTGGLPGKNDNFGFWMMVSTAAFLTLITWQVVRYKILKK